MLLYLPNKIFVEYCISKESFLKSISFRILNEIRKENHKISITFLSTTNYTELKIPGIISCFDSVLYTFLNDFGVSFGKKENYIYTLQPIRSQKLFIDSSKIREIENE